MTSYKNALDYAKDKMQQGLLTADQANVFVVQMMGVRVIEGPILSTVRKALNAAVKAGELGHIKKDGLRPEAYHHKNGRANALTERDRIFREKTATIKSVHEKILA